MAAKMTALRLPEELHAKLAVLAKTQDRSVNYLINSAVKHLIEDNEQMVAAVERGVADIAAGRVTAHEDVMLRGDNIIQAAASRKHMK
jgi:predicted transcriptional regulator